MLSQRSILRQLNSTIKSRPSLCGSNKLNTCPQFTETRAYGCFSVRGIDGPPWLWVLLLQEASALAVAVGILLRASGYIHLWSFSLCVMSYDRHVREHVTSRNQCAIAIISTSRLWRNGVIPEKVVLGSVLFLGARLGQFRELDLLNHFRINHYEWVHRYVDVRNAIIYAAAE